MSWHINCGQLLLHWADKIYGDATCLPDRYMIIDIETTGLSPELNRIFQIGTALYNGTEVIAGSIVLETPFEIFEPDALAVTNVTEEFLKQHGRPREPAMREFFEFYVDMLEEGYLPVGHNLLQFDANFLREEFARIGLDFEIPSYALDTGLVVKAAQLGMVPEEFESFRDFLLRVGEVRAMGIKWKLSGFCDKEFQIDALAPDFTELMEKQAHSAHVDCLKVFLLLDRFKEYAKGLLDGTLKLDDLNEPDTFYEHLLRTC